MIPLLWEEKGSPYKEGVVKAWKYLFAGCDKRPRIHQSRDKSTTSGGCAYGLSILLKVLQFPLQKGTHGLTLTVFEIRMNPDRDIGCGQHGVSKNEVGRFLCGHHGRCIEVAVGNAGENGGIHDA